MANDIDLSVLSDTGLNLDQYFGLWAVDDSLFMAQLDRIAQMNLLAHVEIHQASGEPVSRARVSKQGGGSEGKIASIRIQGTMTKQGSSLSDAGSTVQIRNEVRKAARDSDVSGILLVIDSPGGTVAGTADLAREVAKAREAKPVFAFIEDLAASAAFWVASQSDRVFANDNTALVGSIGTFVGLHDLSGAAKKEGIRAVVIKAGKFKGAGFPGTEITDEQKALWQSIVDSTQAEFTAAIASGRRLSISAAEELVQGRVWLATEALDLKLIDGIQTIEDTVSQLITMSRTRRTRTMSNEITTTLESSTKRTAVPIASFEELESSLPGADSDFVLGQLRAKATLSQAQSAWMTAQNERLVKAQKATDTATKAGEKAVAEAKATVKPGLDVKGEGEGNSGDGNEAAYGGDPIAEWNKRLQAKVDANMPRMQAASRLNAEEPGLREAMVEAYNVQQKALVG